MGVITKYKFNNTLYDYFPEFNGGFTYTYTDEVNGTVTTRTIESDSSPTLIRFGRVYVDGETATDNRTDSLLEVITLNVSVTNASSMFRYCSSLTELDVSGFDTSNVTNMYCMFADCSKLTDLDVSGFNTANVTTMYNMFYNCSSLTSLDLSGFDTSNVANMYGMFYDCSKLTSLDLSGFDTSNVTDMSSVFRNCSSLTSLDLSGFDTSNVTTMYSMFNNCSKLTSLDVSGFDTAKVTNMAYMFYDCSKLTTLDLSYFNTSKVTRMDFMFYNCSNLTSLDVSVFDTSSVTRMEGMFQSCSGLTSLDLSGFDTANVTQMYNMFHGCSSLTDLDLSDFDTSKVTRMDSMFSGCSNLTSLDVSVFDTSSVTRMDGMFNDCSSLTSLDLSGFDTSNVTTINNMFQNCSSLTSLDVSGFDTAKVTNMNSMFNNCSKLTSLDLSSFDTSNVDQMWAMFYNCSSLTDLDVSGFDTVKAITMVEMFRNCSKLTSLDLSGFDTVNATQMQYMFDNCSNLKEIGLIYASIDTINDISVQAPQTTIFIDENLDTSEYTGTALLKVYETFTTTITLTTSLKKVGDKADRLYWDDTDKCYYIEQWIDPNTNAVLATPNKIASAISLPINMKVFEGETSVDILNCEPSYMKCTVPYFDIPDDYEYNEADELEYIKQSFELRYPDEEDVPEGWGFMGLKNEVTYIDYWLHNNKRYTSKLNISYFKTNELTIKTETDCDLYVYYYNPSGDNIEVNGEMFEVRRSGEAFNVPSNACYFAFTNKDNEIHETVTINEIQYYYGKDITNVNYNISDPYKDILDNDEGLKALIDWVDNCTDEEFVRDFEEHFHKDYTLRYFCLVTLIGAVDRENCPL